jgi:hypothetical protein
MPTILTYPMGRHIPTIKKMMEKFLWEWRLGTWSIRIASCCHHHPCKFPLEIDEEQFSDHTCHASLID